MSEQDRGQQTEAREDLDGRPSQAQNNGSRGEGVKSPEELERAARLVDSMEPPDSFEY